MPALAVESLTIAFGGVRAIDDLSFEVAPGTIHAVIGPNGAGKTTLFNVVTGVYRARQGRVRLGDRDISDLAPHQRAALGLSRTFQNLQIFFRMSVLENVLVGGHRHVKQGVLAHMLRLPGLAAAERAAADRARELLAFVGLEDQRDRSAGALPYGMLKRLEIARALAAEPSILLLDEPAAGLNPAETGALEELIRAIAARGTTVLLVEHDMKLVMSLSERILVLDQGRRLAEGTAAEIRAHPDVIAAYLGRAAGEDIG
jgi:branched-chain amino acid transport system ATP-binding protein